MNGSLERAHLPPGIETALKPQDIIVTPPDIFTPFRSSHVDMVMTITLDVNADHSVRGHREDFNYYVDNDSKKQVQISSKTEIRGM